MKAYQINIAPRTGVGMGFVTVGENENHALAEFSKSLRFHQDNQRQNSVT
jgi:hypothetical protein